MQLRHDQVIDRLDSIDSKLDIVISNQRLLMTKMDEINNNVRNAVKELKTIKYVSYVTAYNTMAIKQNTAAIADNTAAAVWYSKCTALNTSNGFSQNFRARTGLDFSW